MNLDMAVSTHHRQLDLFNPKEHQFPVVIGGAGTIGSWTALGLAKMGVQYVSVFDRDTIENHNIANQLYPSVAGGTKIAVLNGLVNMLTDEMLIVPYGEFLPAGFDLRSFSEKEFIYISAVDSMKARAEVWNWVLRNPDRVPYYIDCRMGGNVTRVLALSPRNQESVDYYNTTLYADKPEGEEQVQNEEARALGDVPCTAASIIYTAYQSASLVIAAARKFMVNRDSPEFRDITADLDNMFFVSAQPSPIIEDTEEDYDASSE